MTRALLSRVALLVAAGLAGGALVALVLGSFMTLIPGIGRIEPLPVFAVAVAVAAVAFAAAYVPLRRATRVDPLTALRAE